MDSAPDTSAHGADGRFAGKTALITGAGGQIGAATARRLGADGARVLVVDLDPHGIETTVDAVRAAGGVAEGFVADVTEAASVAAYASAGAALGDGRVELFFNNAGIEGPVAPIEEYTDEDFDQVIAVNVRGLFLGLKRGAATVGPSPSGRPCRPMAGRSFEVAIYRERH